MRTNSARRRTALGMTSIAVSAALTVLPVSAHAESPLEGWKNWNNFSCGSAKVLTESWSNGLTEHYQRTVGGALWSDSWDNQGIIQQRRRSFGLSSLSFAQVWTSHLLVRGDITCV